MESLGEDGEVVGGQGDEVGPVGASQAVSKAAKQS